MPEIPSRAFQIKIKGAIALVTGANRGLGLHFVEELADFGAAKIYATDRTNGTLDPLVRKHGGLVANAIK